MAAPIGAAIVTAAGVLWRRVLHEADERARANDAALAYERERTRRAEERLDALGQIMKAATDVMEKSVATTDRVVELLNVRDRFDVSGHGET